jgi:hypothetical protein
MDRHRKRYTKTQGEQSETDKEKGAQRHEKSNERWTKEKVHKDTRRKLKGGQRKKYMKTKGEHSDRDKGKGAWHMEGTHRGTKEKVHDDTRTAVTRWIEKGKGAYTQQECSPVGRAFV